MQSNFHAVFKQIVGAEGGFVNDPRDRGGATKYGVTQAVLKAWRRKDVTVDDVMKLSLDEAELIFKTQYWDAVKGDRLPAGIDLLVADTAYNSGAGRAIEFLQRVLDLKVDRVMGEVTLSTAASADATKLIDDYCHERLRFLRTTYGWKTYGNGWTNRVNHAHGVALAMTHMSGDRVAEAAPPLEPMGGTQADHDQKFTKTPSGQAKVVALVGATGTAASDAANQIAPLTDYLPTIKYLFLALTVLGIVAGAYLTISKIKEEDAC